MATAASQENEENTATGGQRTLDGNVLPAVKRSRMSYTREYKSSESPMLVILPSFSDRFFAHLLYIPSDRVPTLYIARGPALIKWAFSTAHKRILACSLPCA